MSYATATQLAAWLGEDQAVPDQWDKTRILERASATVDRLVTAAYTLDDDDAPADEDVVEALCNATCAVVEYWLTVGGEDVDRMILGGPVGFDGASVGTMPSWQAPRAVEILRQAGLRGEPGLR